MQCYLHIAINFNNNERCIEQFTVLQVVILCVQFNTTI